MPHPVEDGAAIPLAAESPFFSHQMEAIMSRVISFDKGSKRRIRQIRWKIHEISSAALLSLIILLLGVLVAFWEVSHYSGESRTPQIRVQH